MISKLLKLKVFGLTIVLFSLFLVPHVSAQTSDITCEPKEYACWGRNVPILPVSCDDVYEREISICNTFGDEPCPCGCVPDGMGGCNIPASCPSECCSSTEYSCSLCSAGVGKIFPWPERPEGEHGDANLCPTEDDIGQPDGTGYEEDFGRLVFDYDTNRLLDALPVQWGNVPPPPTPTLTPPWDATPTPTDGAPPLTPMTTVANTPTPTVTPTGPTPTPGWPTHTPTPTPSITNTPTPITPTATLPPIPEAPCGWPLDEDGGAGRRITGQCGIDPDNTPSGASEVQAWLHEFNGTRYDAIDIGTGNYGNNQPSIKSTMDNAYGYRCVNTTSVGGGGFGVYVIVSETQGNFDGFSTLYAHLEAESGDVEPGDPSCNPGSPCMSGDCLVSEGPVNRGDVIGRTGWTGPISGLHLHYEVWYGGRLNRVCPASFMDLSADVCGGTDDTNTVIDFLKNGIAEIIDWVQTIIAMVNPFADSELAILR